MRGFVALTAMFVIVASCSDGTESPTLPDPLREGRATYTASCVVCHGDRGEGGIGAELTGVTETFPDCSDQLRWISLGSRRWRDEVGATYGTTDKPIQGAMPSFEVTLDDTAIRSVAAFERVEFGGADPVETLASCGLQGDPASG